MTEPAAPDDEAARYRLPRSVVPSRYDLTLEPDLDAGTFSGSEDVTVTVVDPVDEIVLNADELVLRDGWLEGPGGRLEVTEVRMEPETERAHLRLSGTAEPGDWTLHLAFDGTLSDRMQGFYRSTYADEAGVERVIAATQLESTDARRAFPGWDEPEAKAMFGVTLVVRDGLLAISNGAEVGREDLGDGRVRVRFADTMPMSTYLAAFIVGPLEVTEPMDVDGVPLRVVHQPGKEHLTAFALEVGAFCLRFFRDYYGIDYPGDKLDMVALPDFAQGAMENLGCITYRESLLLVDPHKATQPELAAVADVIAHEIAHMWFGDLVTMRWWNGIWLNEAFATFMELVAVDAYRPDWERWSSFLRVRATAFEVDALESTRPIEYPVHSPDDAAGMFDILTYTKGAAVLRMLEQYLGAERFRDGIRRYLTEHRFGNTETHDLWDALEASSGEPVRRIMDGWIFQGGYPEITTELGSDGSVALTQRRYRISRDTPDATWDVPLLVRTGTKTAPLLIEPAGTSIVPEGDDPVVVNAGAHAFTRVRYDEVLLAGSPASSRGCPPTSARSSSTTRGPRSWPGEDPRRRSAGSRPRSAARRSSPSGRPCWRASGGASGSSTASRASASARSSARWSVRRSRGSAGNPRKGSATWTSRCAARSCPRSGSSAPTPTRRRCRARSSASRAPAATWTRRSRPPRSP